MNKNEDTYKSILKTHSNILIVQDGKTLVTLLQSIHNSAMTLSLIPFCALYCRSAKEFLCIEENGNEIEKEVKDIRDGLKIFTGKYSKGKKMAVESDDQQNEIFQSKLRFSFTKKLNIHLNLGVYFNEQGKVVFDTQLASFYLNIPKSNEASSGAHGMMVGQKLGKEMAEILIKYYGINDLADGRILFNSVPKYGYIDFNTNKKNVFFNKNFDKETNLVLLHMLSTIGFVNNLLVPVFPDKNVWLLRIIYITAHNTWLGINKFRQHFEQEHQSKIEILDYTRGIKEDIKLLSTPFRNCMMHYDLVDKNNHPIILQEWYDSEKPLYGLVESCYDGMHFNQYYNEIYKLSQELEKYLLSYFTINRMNIHWDWD